MWKLARCLDPFFPFLVRSRARDGSDRLLRPRLQINRFQSHQHGHNKSTDWILHILEEDTEQPDRFPDISYNDKIPHIFSELLGYSYLRYSYTKYLLQHHFSLENDNLKKKVDAFIRFLDSKLNKLSTEYVGQFIIQDLPSCKQFVNSLIRKSVPTTNNQSSFHQALNDQIKHLEPKYQQLVQKLTISSNLLKSLPNNTPIEPKYFLDSSKLNMSYRLLEEFGDYSLQFHLLYFSKPNKSPNEYLLSSKQLVLDNSSRLMDDFKNGFSDPSLIVKYKQGLLFRYLAFLDLKDSDLSEWYQKNSQKSSLVPDTELFHKPSKFHAGQLLVFAEFVHELHLSEIESTGSLFIYMNVWEYLWKTVPESHTNFRTYTKFFNDMLDLSITHELMTSVFPQIEMESTNAKSFIGLFALHDIEACKSFIQSFFKKIPEDFTTTRRYLLKVMKDKNIHLLKYAEVHPSGANNMNLPSLDVRPKVTRFVLQNLDAVAYRDPSIYHIIKELRLLGSFQNSFYLNYWLFRTATSVSVAYITQIRKFYLSSYFNKFLLDGAKVFDGIFDDKKYKHNLIRARNNFEFAENQYNQFLTALALNGNCETISKYNERSITLFMEVILKLSSVDIASSLKSIYQNDSYSFSLDDLYVNSMVKKFNQAEVVPPEITNTTNLNSPHLDGLSKHFLSFLSCEFIMRLRLYEFIPTRRVYEKLIKIITQQPKFIDALHGCSVGSLLCHNDTKTVHINILQLLEPTLGSLPRSGFNINKVEMIERSPQQSQLTPSLPELPKDSSYGKVACINYHISNAYLKSINQGPPRVVEEYCSKLGTTGQEFFRFAIRKQVISLNQQYNYKEEYIDELIKILDSGYLYTTIALESDILFGCINDPVYTKLVKLQIQNSYQLIRLSKAAFKQYIGALCLHEIALVEDYVNALVQPIMDLMSEPECLQTLTYNLTNFVGATTKALQQSK